MSDNRPKDLINQAPERQGFVRYWAREDQMPFMTSVGWDTVKKKDGDKFLNRLNDPVGNVDKAGTLHLLEMPKEDYKKYMHEHNGGKQIELQMKALKRNPEEKNFRDRIKSERKDTDDEMRMEEHRLIKK